jgi:hypothetical protein
MFGQAKCRHSKSPVLGSQCPSAARRLPLDAAVTSLGAMSMEERRTEWARRARFDEVRKDVTERVSHLVTTLPTDEADALIRRMTLVQLKYEVANHPHMS